MILIFNVYKVVDAQISGLYYEYTEVIFFRSPE